MSFLGYTFIKFLKYCVEYPLKANSFLSIYHNDSNRIMLKNRTIKNIGISYCNTKLKK